MNMGRNLFHFYFHKCRICHYIPLCALYLAELSARADTSLSDSEPRVSYSIPQPPSPQESNQHVTLVELLVIICECLGCTGGLPLVYEFTMSHGKPVPILLIPFQSSRSGASHVTDISEELLASARTFKGGPEGTSSNVVTCTTSELSEAPNLFSADMRI
ncbi:hypothetical protein GQX74_012861 [Glossina fuscipes]|nr:hypothetical protein GQX74_012861 [Glossina fuscipes]